MKTKALRLYGVDDVRLEEFDLPELQEDEILVKVITDSVCMSTYKTVKQGKKHKRVPQDIDINPIILGHEMAGEIIQVGSKWASEFKAGEKFALQPALNYKGSLASPGYSYRYFGGDCTYCILPHEVMELGCLLHYHGETYFEASLGEPVSCIIGGYHANYHTSKTSYTHLMGVKPNGYLLIMGGCGPMGLGAVDYALQLDKPPKKIIVTDVSDERLARAKTVLPTRLAAEKGIELYYVDPRTMSDQIGGLLELSEGHGYDDVFVYVPIKPLVEQADKLLAFDGCLNFFAGPTDKDFSALINMYNVHYINTHVMGSTGGNTNDLLEALDLSAKKRINPSLMVTHIGGLDSAGETTLNLPVIRGGKKLIYTHISLPLTAIDDFGKFADQDPLFDKLNKACQKVGGLWNKEAEDILLSHFNIS